MFISGSVGRVSLTNHTSVVHDNMITQCVMHISVAKTVLKGELKLDNKWQSDDLFYIIMNEIHHRFNQF